MNGYVRNACTTVWKIFEPMTIRSQVVRVLAVSLLKVCTNKGIGVIIQCLVCRMGCRFSKTVRCTNGPRYHVLLYGQFIKHR